MSSTYSIKKRLRERDPKYLFTNTLGDTYIRPYGKCHPDFLPVSVDQPGKPEGVNMCVRQRESFQTDRSVNYGTSVSGGTVIRRGTNIKPGENREGISPDSTKMPNQDYLLARDYLRWETNVNGLGIPNSLKNAQGRDGYFRKMNNF
jgi:hypothetical protein